MGRRRQVVAARERSRELVPMREQQGGTQAERQPQRRKSQRDGVVQTDAANPRDLAPARFVSSLAFGRRPACFPPRCHRPATVPTLVAASPPASHLASTRLLPWCLHSCHVMAATPLSRPPLLASGHDAASLLRFLLCCYFATTSLPRLWLAGTLLLLPVALLPPSHVSLQLAADRKSVV